MREWDHDPERPGSLRLRICEWGDPHGRPLVILHGFLEQAAAWDAVARQLPGRVIAPDHRGHGRSEHVGRGGFYHFWDYVGDLDSLIEAIGGPVDLVGHSMGGSMACLYAGSRPEQVRRLALVEGLGPPDTTEDAVRRARQFLAHRRQPPRHRTLADPQAAANRIRRYNPRIDPQTALRLAERSVQPEGERWVWSWDPLHRSRSPVPFSAELFSRFLREITAPTLVIDGADSAHLSEDHLDRMAQLPHSERYLVPGAGHLVHHDQPDVLAARLRAWFEGARPTTSSPG